VKTALTMTYAVHLRFLLMSSISAVQSWPPSRGKAPEDSKIESEYAVGIGYGESKYVAERVRQIGLHCYCL
jgi:thioester reductase-like protein